MKRLASVSLGILITFCLVVGSERRAWGYVDPGSGLVALQTMASVAAAYAFVVRRRIRAFFQRRKPSQDLVMPVSAEVTKPSKAA